MRRPIWLACAGGYLLACSGAADAEADPGSAMEAACKGNPTDEKLRERLAEAMLNQAGVLASDLVADTSLGANVPIGERALRAAFVQSVKTVPASSDDIHLLRQRLEQQLASTSNVKPDDRKIIVDNAPPFNPAVQWLFDPTRSLNMHCLEGKKPKDTIAEEEKGSGGPMILLREKIEELSAVGDDAKKVGAVRIGLTRTTTAKDDGTAKRTTALSVNGTIGVRVRPASSGQMAFAYASYALSRERTHPSDPSTNQSDGDVEALEAGLTLNDFFLRRASDLTVVGSFRGGFVADFAHHAQRAKIALSLVPAFKASLPMCGFNGFAPLAADEHPIWGRCLLVLETEGSHVFNAGTADFKDRGNFLAAGGHVAYELAAKVGDDTDIIGSISYRYMPTIFGTAPNLKRWDASIKYRLWTDSGIGFDFGLTWAHGTEPISYEKENKLELGFGIVR